jgi:glycosyltransferase involved in cell wall biosynthesis
MESGRQFQTKDCDYFNMPLPTGFRSNSAWKRRVRGTTRSMMLYLRARKYSAMLDRPDVVHFQQVLNGYGSKALFSWLKLPSSAARVVTVHELDADQLEFPETNLTYNRADAIIVHCAEMKEQLIRLGVQPEKIHTILHGTTVPTATAENSRDGILFYGGHKIKSGKGIDTVFKAMSIIRKQRPENVPVLRIHGHYGSETPADAARLAADNGIADHVVWLNQIPEDELVPLYQRSLLCVLPFTGSFAGMAASIAAACQLPVICTRKAGLPDHLGDAGIWVDENNPEQLAAKMIELLDSQTLRQQVGARLLKRAQEHLDWNVVAAQTLVVYEEAKARKSAVVNPVRLSANQSQRVVA